MRPCNQVLIKTRKKESSVNVNVSGESWKKKEKKRNMNVKTGRGCNEKAKNLNMKKCFDLPYYRCSTGERKKVKELYANVLFLIKEREEKRKTISA